MAKQLEMTSMILDSNSEDSELENEMDFTPNGAKSSHELASPVQKETDYPRKKDKKTAGPVHTRNDLQHYYEVLAEKLSADIAQTVVWEGAAKNAKIEIGLKYWVEERSFGVQGDEQAALVAMLFSGQLDSEKKMKEHFLPALKTIATTELEEFRVVAVYMLMMLLNKKPENGISLVTNALPSKAYYRLMGDTVRRDYEGQLCDTVVMPKLDQVLSTDEFRELLVQDMEDLGEDGKVSWILLLGYSPESIHGALVDRASGLLWSELFTELSDMLETKGNDVIEGKSKTRMVNIWGDVTTTEERKAALQKLREDLDHKEFEKLLDVIMSIATYPLDDMEGEKDAPCLLVSCPTTHQAVKLFQHTTGTLGEFDVEHTVTSLIKQNIGDRELAAVIRELAASQRLSDDFVDDVLLNCCSIKSLIQSCAELLRVVPNPRTHPFMEILQECDEKASYKALEILNPDLYAPNCRLDDTNALHLAGTLGYTRVCKEILARGFHRLLYKPGDVDFSAAYEDLRPASMAVKSTNFATAKVLLQGMEPDKAKKLCTVQKNGKRPEIKLHQVMEEVSKGRGGRWDEEAWKRREWQAVPQQLEKKEVQERVDFLETALDTAVKGRYVDLSVLTQDENGRTSQQFRSGEDQKQPDLEEGKKTPGKSFYRKISQSDNCDKLKTHECFATLTNLIWIDYGIVQGLLFSLYLLFMTFLTTSLVLAARSTDPSQYDDGLDWFRLGCEAVTLLWVMVDLALESYELGRVIYRSLKQSLACIGRRRSSTRQMTSGSDSDNDEEEEPDEENSNCCVALANDVLSEYLLHWQNMLDDLALLGILIIIPFRFMDSDVQWVFAALAFMFHGLRTFKYAIMFKSVGEYVAILVLLIKRDVPQFVTVFLVIIFSLGGALYFALIGHYNENNMDTENNNDTSEVYLLWWTGIRILAEGSALTYYGPGGFNWLGVLIYWLFLFIVVVVLLNILIAQFSKSYEEETERAQINVILRRAQIILKMEQSALTRRFVPLVRRIRIKLTRNSMEYQRVERLNLTGERDESKPASSEQVEELQTRTTNLGLQLRKQMDDSIGRSIRKVEEMVKDKREGQLSQKSDVLVDLERAVLDTREALQSLKGEIEGRLVGLERAVLDTRRYVDDIKKILKSMKEK